MDIKPITKWIMPFRNVSSRWLCSLMLHNWTKWGQPMVGTENAGTMFEGKYVSQKRRCRKCGAVEFRLV